MKQTPTTVLTAEEKNILNQAAQVIFAVRGRVNKSKDKMLTTTAKEYEQLYDTLYTLENNSSFLLTRLIFK